ncbi:MAG: methylenetetrahydrofolate reductase [Candidatus Dormibacteria bacterium]
MFPAAERSAELAMPRRAHLEPVRQALVQLARAVGVVGLTDNHMGRPRLSPLAAVPACLAHGLRPIVHVSCRDRNLLGLRQQVIGAAALGAAGVLVVRGDRKEGMVDSRISVVDVLADIPDWALPQELLRGAVVNPFADRPRELRLLARKVGAGIDFLQTQMIFDLDAFDSFLEDARDVLPPEVAVFASVGVIRSERSLDFVRASLPGCPVPDHQAARIRAGQGLAVAADTAAEIGRRPGLRLHLITRGAEQYAAEIGRAFTAARAAG